MFVGGNTLVVVLEDPLIRSTLIFSTNPLSQFYSTPEIETYVKGIYQSDNLGREIIIKFQTEIKNEGVFYTDSNGLDLMRREINKRPTYTLHTT